MPNNKSSKASKIPERVLPAAHNYGQPQRKIRQITVSVPVISSESDMELDSYNFGGCIRQCIQMIPQLNVTFVTMLSVINVQR